ncbi:MAG: dUTP diphosphatase [Saccharofermentanales bacterium]|nr:aminotransferase [Clostridiaceae bacterium]
MTMSEQQGQVQTTVYLRPGPQGRTPVYATAGSAGCDLYASAPITLLPGETRLLPLDLVMALEPGVEAQVRPRSGLSLNTTLRIPNAPGTIDSDYRSPMGVIVENTFNQGQLVDRILARPELLDEILDQCQRTTVAAHLSAAGREAAADRLREELPELAEQILFLDRHGNPYGTIYIQTGDRIAQLVLSYCLQGEFVQHEQPELIGSDRGGGFGSTGFSGPTGKKISRGGQDHA